MLLGRHALNSLPKVNGVTPQNEYELTDDSRVLPLVYAGPVINGITLVSLSLISFLLRRYSVYPELTYDACPLIHAGSELNLPNSVYVRFFFTATYF